MTAAAESVVFTGRNAAEVRAFVDPADSIHGWFITRAQTAPTGGQAWRYVKDGQTWPDDVVAALYDPAWGDWSPVRRGDTIRRVRPTTLGGRYYEVVPL